MNLKFYTCLFLLVPALTSLAATTNAPATNSLAKATNTVAIETNKPAGPPTALEDTFTNSVDMVLLKISGNLWAGKYDVTQKEYQKIMGSNPSAFGGKNNPVDSVSWDNAMNFCKKMTEEDTKEQKIPVGFYYTLPTEDEWETLMADASLDNAITSANGNRSGTAPVGTLKPNSLGLYDMRGNVSQWTLGDDSKAYRVLRGGNWSNWIDINLRPIFRIYVAPDTAQNTFGFRCVLKKK
jgi:formylglycine-generating enzyme required for sulfatase activity